mgnify:CR=1 FL=1
MEAADDLNEVAVELLEIGDVVDVDGDDVSGGDGLVVCGGDGDVFVL